MAKKTTLSYSDAIAELETIVNKLQNNEYEIDIPAPGRPS